jgi:hypothetical protein
MRLVYNEAYLLFPLLSPSIGPPESPYILDLSLCSMPRFPRTMSSPIFQRRWIHPEAGVPSGLGSEANGILYLDCPLFSCESGYVYFFIFNVGLYSSRQIVVEV